MEQQLKEIYEECFPEKNFDLLWSSIVGGHSRIDAIEKDDKIISFIIYKEIGDNEAEILDIGTAKDSRKNGFAKKLVEGLTEFKTLFLEVDERNLAAVNLYQKLGFKVVGKRKNYYKHKNGNSDALNMIRSQQNI